MESIQTINYSIIEFDEGSSINVKSIEIVKDEKVFVDDLHIDNFIQILLKHYYTLFSSKCQ